MQGSMPGMALWLMLLIVPVILAVISLIQANSDSDHTVMGKDFHREPGELAASRAYATSRPSTL